MSTPASRNSPADQPRSAFQEGLWSLFKGSLGRFLRNEYVELVIAMAILASIGTLLAEAALPASHPLQLRLLYAGEAFTLFFAFELSLRWLVSVRTGDFLSEYWLDVLAIAPLLRPLRFLRILRLLRLFRASLLLHRRSRRFLGTLAESSGEYILLAVFLFTATMFAAIGLMQVEGHQTAEFKTFGSSLWWTILSMAAGQPTDVLPATDLGKALTLFVILSGATVFAMFTGIVSAVMVERLRRRMDDKEMKIEELSSHIVVCGWNRSGSLLVKELQRDTRHVRTPIVIVGEFPTHESIDFSGLRSELIYVVRGDFTRIAVLEQTNVRRASIVIILSDQVVVRSDQDRDARTVLAALTIEKMAPGIFTCVELLNAENESHLRMAGVEEVVIQDILRADMLAVSCLSRGFGRTVRDLLSNASGHGFYTAEVPGSWAGLPLSSVFEPLKRAANAVVIGLVSGGEVRPNPPLDIRLAAGDRLVVVGDKVPDLSAMPVPRPAA